MFNSIERQELEAEQAAREDYLHEAYGREVETVEQVEADQREHEAGRYCPTTLAQFQSLFKSAKGWAQGFNYNEVVFDYYLKAHPTIFVRVFTGIDTRTGAGRACGKDAIRVAAINGKVGWIKSSHIKRVPGWQERLQAKVLEVIQQSKDRLTTF